MHENKPDTIPLINSILKGDTENFRSLLRQGDTRIEETNSNGLSALHCAARTSSGTYLQEILSLKPNVSCQKY